MPTYSALTTLPGKESAEALGLAMERMDPEPTGIGVFELEDGSGLWEVGGYFVEAPDIAALAILAAAFGAEPFVLSEVPEVDWVAKVRRELAPVPAGRFFVYGAHDADKVPDDSIPLLIEASMAFGTGHHGTTLGCLLAFERLLAEGKTPVATADIGCGTAVLAMAAAKVWGGQVPVLASDIDPVAVDVATANLAANGVGAHVDCFEATGFDHPKLAKNVPFGLVFANILKGPLLELGPHMADAIGPGGHAILSGILQDQADEVRGGYEALGFQQIFDVPIGDWSTLCLLRR